MRTARRLLSPIGVLLAFVAGWWGLNWMTSGSWDAVSAGSPTFDALLIFAISALAWACYVWLALSFLLVALSTVPGAIGGACSALAERVTPQVARRAAKFALGISLVAAPVVSMGPANAATTDNTTQVSQASQVSQSQLPSLDRPVSASQQEQTSNKPAIEGTTLPAPDRPVSGRSAADLPNINRPTSGDAVTRPPTRQAETQPSTHVVVRGDTLWDIAKANLPDDASNAEISTEWQRWYDANRDVIGDDPDLILPGQELHSPDSK